MGKISEKKQQKFEQLLASAQELFLSKGILDTSVSDITTHAGIAKGTFYLYFKDKYSIRDCLIARSAQRLFYSAHLALQNEKNDLSFEDRIIFITDHIVSELETNKPLLRFISKNLSWGLIHQLYTEEIVADHMSGQELYEKVAGECGVTLKDPDIMMFIIIEMISSTTYSAILGNAPFPLEKLMPYLNDTVRSIIKNHMM